MFNPLTLFVSLVMIVPVFCDVSFWVLLKYPCDLSSKTVRWLIQKLSREIYKAVTPFCFFCKFYININMFFFQKI